MAERKKSSRANRYLEAKSSESPLWKWLTYAGLTVLAVLGGLVGVGLAAVLVQLLRAAAPADVPRLGEASLDGMVLASPS